MYRILPLILTFALSFFVQVPVMPLIASLRLRLSPSPTYMSFAILRARVQEQLVFFPPRSFLGEIIRCSVGFGPCKHAVEDPSDRLATLE